LGGSDSLSIRPAKGWTQQIGTGVTDFTYSASSATAQATITHQIACVCVQEEESPFPLMSDNKRSW